MVSDMQQFYWELASQIQKLPELNKEALTLAQQKHPFRWKTFLNEETTMLEQEWTKQGIIYRRDHPPNIVEILNAKPDQSTMYRQTAISYKKIENMRNGISPGNHETINLAKVMNYDSLLDLS